MSVDYVDWIAVTVAALSAFMLGGIWYSPLLFQKSWMEECGLTELDLSRSDPRVTFGGSLILTFIASLMLSVVLGPEPQFGQSILTGLVIGLSWVASSFGVSYLFEQRSLKLFLINGGYHIMQFVTMGTVFGIFSSGI